MTNPRQDPTDVPWLRQWTWDASVAPRWLLVGDVGTRHPAETAVALCTDVSGLFCDLPSRPRERFTLVGCLPCGELTSILANLSSGTDAAGRTWLGNVWIAARPDDPATRRGWIGEQLLDVHVLGQRPSASCPGRCDVDLEGLLEVDDRTSGVRRPDDITELVLTGTDDAKVGVCVDVTGVFREPAEPPVPQVTLIGCRPEPPLLAAIGSLAESTAAGPHRRRIWAEVGAVDANGSAVRLTDAVVSGTIAACAPSALGDRLLDVTIDSDAREPRPAGTRAIVDLWFDGRPTRRNQWVGHDRTLRLEWAGVALAHHRQHAPDRPAGTIFDLDGRFVTDIEGFYCAIGEAVNGPGGYFGWNICALDDCLRGRWGARPPFRLVWHDAAVAREHLVTGYDRLRYAPAVTMDDLLQILANGQVEVELR